MEKIYNPSTGVIWDGLHSHQLSVFFFIIAIGMVFEDGQYSKGLAERYCALGRAALSLDSLAKDTTTYSVLSLFVLSQYYELADRATVECQWQLGGLMSRLAYQVCSTSSI